VVRHWIVWLDSGHRITRHQRASGHQALDRLARQRSSGHQVLQRALVIRRDRIIRLGSVHQAGYRHQDWGRDIRLKCGCRGSPVCTTEGQVLRLGRLTGLDTGRMVLVGKNFCFFLVLTYWSTASKRRSANEWSS
ncbi:unnamed protein product, partial [Staurois parvus]